MDTLNNTLEEIRNNATYDDETKQKLFKKHIKQWNLDELRRRRKIEELKDYKYPYASVYKIVNIKDNKIYVGSTKDKYISNRLCSHYNNWIQYKEGKKNYVSSFTMFDNYGFSNCYIIFLEHKPCNDLKEIRLREKEWIKNNIQLCCNKQIPQRSRSEYFKDVSWFSQKKYYKSNHNEIIRRKKIKRELKNINEKLINDNNNNELLESKNKLEIEFKSLIKKKNYDPLN